MRQFYIRSKVATGAAVAVIIIALSASASAQKRTQTQVPLRVVVQTTDSNNDYMQVTGDGRASADRGYLDPNEYVHGVDGVTAVLGEYGGITIDFQPSASAPRRLFFDYSHLDNSAFRPTLEPVVYSGLRTHLDSTNVPLQQMTVASTQCIAMGIAYTLGDSKQTSYRNSYQAKNISSVDTTATAFGVVTRTGVDTWLLESRADGMCNNLETAHHGKLVSNTTTKGKASGFTDHGSYHVGFSMALTRK